jgi:fructokinase
MTSETRWTIVGLGEILWDVFPDGPRFGGAPANFACHSAALGAHAHMASAVGADDLGDRAVATLQRHAVTTECVQPLADFPTGSVQVQVDADGKPRYEFGKDDAWDHLTWSDALADLAARSDAICFGTLGQRHQASRRTIQRFVGATSTSSWRIFDINLRPPFYDEAVIEQSLALANVLKLNDEELAILTPLYGLMGSPANRISQLAEQHDLRLVALTLGSQGALLVRESEVSECSGAEVRVRDTVGAGDAFTAAMTLGILHKGNLDTINRHACRVAEFVCTQPGATPILPDQLRQW